MVDFSSILTIEAIDCVEQDRRRDGVRCAICLQASWDMTGTLPGCSHGVCQSCIDLVKSNDTSIFCVTCQVRSVSPNPNRGQSSSESWRSLPRPLSSSTLPSTSPSMSHSMSSEKHDIVKTQLKKLNHLDYAVYKPLANHFDRLLLNFKNGVEKKIQRVEMRYGEIVDALDKRKGEIIKSLKKNKKANKAIIENKKKAMEKERAQLNDCRRKHQDKLRDSVNSSDITMKSFLDEVDDFQRKARKISTDNSVTEFDDLEIITDSEVESSIKDALNKLVTLQQTAQLLKSRVGTPTSSPCCEEESSLSSSAFSGDESSRHTSQSRRGRSLSLSVPVQPRRTLTPNPPCFSRVPVTQRDVRSAADGRELQDIQPAQFLPDIVDPPPSNAAPARQRPGSDQRHQPVPREVKDAARDNSLDDHPGGCVRSASDKNLLKKRDPSSRRSLPNISHFRQGKLASQVKYQTLMQDELKLERPCGVCCLGNGEKGVVGVADCGQGRIVEVGLDGKVTGGTVVWEDDGESAKAHGVFDIARMEGGCVIVSDSHQKEVILFERGRRLHSLGLPAQTDPRGVTSHGHHIFIRDQGNHCVQMLDFRDKNDIKPKATTIALCKPNEHLMVRPYFVSVDRTGERILVSDYGNGALILARTDNAQPPLRVKLVASSAMSQNGRRCAAPATNIEIRPTGVAWLPDGRGAVVADQIGHRLVVVDEELKVVGSFGRQGSGDGEFLFPHGVTLVSDTTLSVCDMNNARIQFVQLEALLANIN